MPDLFIYWRTPAATAPRALQAASRWQAVLREQHPGLVAAVYRRTDDRGSTATLMEVYAAPIDATLERRIIDEGARVLGPWLEGPRHVEMFERCNPD